MRLPRTHIVMTLLLALVVFCAGCGVPRDESPNVIGSQSLPPELRPGQLPTSEPASTIGPGSEDIFMIQDGASPRLVTVERPIVDTPEGVMDLLVRGTFPQESAEGISSALGRNTNVQNLEHNRLLELVIVDLAPGSLPPSNSEQKLAFAQMVYTLTSVPGVETVQFVQTDPENPAAGPIDLPVQTDDGSTVPGARVTRADFAKLRPSDAPQISFDDLPVITPTPTPDPNAPPTFPVPIWMVEDDQLVKVSRTLELDPDSLLVALLNGVLPGEFDQGLRSALPLDALARPVQLEIGASVLVADGSGGVIPVIANVATIDLNSGSLPSETDGTERLLAAAQIVYTMTELATVDLVMFSIEGQSIPMITDQGLTTVPRGLSREDYDAVVPGGVVPVPPGTAVPPVTAVPPAPDPEPSIDEADPAPTATIAPGEG